MVEKVKIYEIAKRAGISSAELVEICQRAGYKDIKHHSNVVPPDQAEEIRKAAIRLYRPKEPVPVKQKPKPEPKKVEAEQKKAPPRPVAPKKEPPKVPLPAQVKLAAPPTPKGWRARVAERELEDAKHEVRALGRAAGVEEEVQEQDRVPAPVRPAGRERPARRAKEKPREEQPGARSVKRTVVFKQIRKVPVKKKEEKIELTLPVSVRDLSERLGVSASDIIRRLLLEHQIRANINQDLDKEVVELLGIEYGVEIALKEPKGASQLLKELIPTDRPEELRPRPPVVTLLGHVDHGKTSILDRIRNTQVAATEDGGITQAIGAWQIGHKGRPLTFIDTPGHEAFTAMRARGAQVTDVVILVVAADDGVMAQTEEAISHARAAGVPIVVALNKMDKPEASPMRVLQQLAAHGLNPEEWGGPVGCVRVSALTGQGTDDLIERTLLEAELLELKANPDRRANGAVLEARMEEGRGVVASIVIRSGTLRKGDIMVCGPAYGRVRSMLTDRGEEIESAGPSTPVAVSGLDVVPEAGDTFVVVDDQDVARNIAQMRRGRLEKDRRRPRAHVTLENLYQSLAAGRERHLRLVLKADVQGSLEPLVESLQRIGTEEVSVRLLHQGVGSVNVSDVLLADASDAVILAFRVTVEERARVLAKECGVDIRHYRVIYDAVQAVRDALEGLLEPELREEKVGVLEVRQVFKISRVGSVAGCYVREGQVRRAGRIRLLRNGTVMHDGTIASLRRGKNDVREVESGFECGIKLEGYDDIQVGDLIECYAVKELKRALS